MHLLLVQDNPTQVALVQRAFATQNNQTRLSIASTLADARAKIKDEPPHLIIADYQLPDGTGVELLFQASNAPKTPVVIMIDYGNERLAAEAIKAGALDYLVKTPETLADLPHLAERWWHQWNTLAEKTRIENELRLRAEAETIWRMVGKTIVSNQTFDQVLGTVIQIIKDKTRVEAGAILLWDATTQKISFAQVLQRDAKIYASVFLNKGEGIAGWVIEHGRSALVPDVRQDPRWQPRVDEQTGFQTRSILCVPLIARDEVIGAIELVNKIVGNFTEADLQLLESLAAPLAIAIQNARLQDQVHQHLADLTRMFDKVEHAKQEWEQTIDVIDAGIWLVDLHCQIARANRTLANWLHTTPQELAGKYCYQVIHQCDTPPAYCPVQHSADALAEEQNEIQLAHLGGGTFRLNTYLLRQRDGTISGAVNVLRDITNELALQSQLIQSEKLAAIGRLAGSLAHEINNPLQALQGCLDLALANPNNIEKQARYLNVAKSEVERLASMVQRLLDFYRPSKGARGPVDIAALVEEVLTLSSKRLQHAQITTQIEWDEDLPVIYGVPNQLKQVFLNLVLNAIDAMPNGGKLKIHGRLVEKEKRWLVIDFADTGVGIPPENLDKIFEPFYTTKPSGTGLGLGISHTIVSSHGGQIKIASVAGVGSTFSVWLPVRTIKS
jgi:signal transduction histidine kinase/response regulator of citrate/malate metabolism